MAAFRADDLIDFGGHQLLDDTETDLHRRRQQSLADRCLERFES